MASHTEQLLQNLTDTAINAGRPEHAVMSSFYTNLAQASGTSVQPTEPLPGIFYPYKDTNSTLRDSLLSAEVAGLAESYPFNNLLIARVGGITIRCLGLGREADFRPTSELMGFANRLLLVSRPIELAHAAITATIYGENGATNDYLSGVNSVVTGSVIEPEVYVELQERTDELLEQTIKQDPTDTLFDRIPAGSREVTLQQIRDLTEAAAGEGRKLYSDTGAMVIDISRSLLKRYQAGITERAQYLSDTYGHSFEAVKEKIESDKGVQDLLTKVVRGINLLQIGSYDDPDALPGVVLCPNELFDVVLPMFSKHESDLPDELARNTEHRLRMMHYQGRLLLLGPSPLGDYSYLHVLNDKEGS